MRNFYRVGRVTGPTEGGEADVTSSSTTTHAKLLNQTRAGPNRTNLSVYSRLDSMFAPHLYSHHERFAFASRHKPITQQLYKSAPSSRQAAKFLTATTLGATLLFLSGLTMTGRVIALIMATPLMVLFSPILVPTGIVIFLVITGLLFSGGCGVAAITALSWIYYYVQVKHPPGADQLDYSRKKLASTARDMTEKAKEYG
ncbi:oleosin 1-like [Durio zibethinus]|uniref:Oleosin 1-like n=1 Tax=Durio zibethinus TaxID=66656 RepID=A0A6P5ZIK6_DURZI|nr:oleosin 1-like [Durio zibethinus]